MAGGGSLEDAEGVPLPLERLLMKSRILVYLVSSPARGPGLVAVVVLHCLDQICWFKRSGLCCHSGQKNCKVPIIWLS